MDFEVQSRRGDRLSRLSFVMMLYSLQENAEIECLKVGHGCFHAYLPKLAFTDILPNEIMKHMKLIKDHIHKGIDSTKFIY
jgi:hypothetical protein